MIRRYDLQSVEVQVVDRVISRSSLEIRSSSYWALIIGLVSGPK